MQVPERKDYLEKAILVSIFSRVEQKEKIGKMEELEALSKTALCEVVGKVIQIKDTIDPNFYVGKGKVFEIKEMIKSSNVDTVIFGAPLSPRHHRNLERIWEIKVVDRIELIMDIFAQHARTREAKIQVELAQLKYRLTQLTGKGRDLSRLGGGIGTRGPGETKLEVDRRKILSRISLLENKLKKIEKTRFLQRKARKNLISIALIGYTNAGKSSLMNILTSSSVRVEDALFSTLDTTTRRFKTNLPIPCVLTDTVGFIEDLPPSLIASFRSTLQILEDVDFIFEIVDISDPEFRKKIRVVEEILINLGLAHIFRIKVFNKIDMLPSSTFCNGFIKSLKIEFIDPFFISCKTGEGIDKLKLFIEKKCEDIWKKKYSYIKI